MGRYRRYPYNPPNHTESVDCPRNSASNSSVIEGNGQFHLLLVSSISAYFGSEVAMLHRAVACLRPCAQSTLPSGLLDVGQNLGNLAEC